MDNKYKLCVDCQDSWLENQMDEDGLCPSCSLEKSKQALNRVIKNLNKNLKILEKINESL